MNKHNITQLLITLVHVFGSQLEENSILYDIDNIPQFNPEKFDDQPSFSLITGKITNENTCKFITSIFEYYIIDGHIHSKIFHIGDEPTNSMSLFFKLEYPEHPLESYESISVFGESLRFWSPRLNRGSLKILRKNSNSDKTFLIECNRMIEKTNLSERTFIVVNNGLSKLIIPKTDACFICEENIVAEHPISTINLLNTDKIFQQINEDLTYLYNNFDRSDKVDESGEYAMFKGITVVADVIDEDNFWTKIYDVLNSNSEVLKYYSLLPKESYHMTYYDIAHQRDIINWNKYFSDNLMFFEKLIQTLDLHSREITAKFKFLIVEGVISVKLTLIQEDVNLIYNIGADMDVENKIPAFFHFTLAYLHRSIDLVTCKQIHDDLSNLFSDNEMTFKIKKPTLRYFFSMKEFLPLDHDLLIEQPSILS